MLFRAVAMVYAAMGDEETRNLSSGSLPFLQVCYTTYISARQERVLILSAKNLLTLIYKTASSLL